MSTIITGTATDWPNARDASLSAFFEDLDINLTLMGYFGIIWHPRNNRLDEIIRDASINPHSGHEHAPVRAASESKQASAYFHPDVCLYDRSSSRPEPPRFTAPNGTKYTFTRATFRDDDRIYIKARIEQTGVAPIEGEYTVEELRRMIGPLPPKPGAWTRLLRGIASLFH